MSIHFSIYQPQTRKEQLEQAFLMAASAVNPTALGQDHIAQWAEGAEAELPKLETLSQFNVWVTKFAKRFKLGKQLPAHQCEAIATRVHQMIGSPFTWPSQS